MSRIILYAIAIPICLSMIACSKSVKQPIAVAQQQQNSSPNPQSRFAINVEAEIKHGSYPERNMVEYQASVRIANTGSMPIEFDEIIAAWVPLNGQPLIAKIRRGSAEYGAEKTDSKGTSDKSLDPVWRLQVGEVHARDVATNGYTQDLLRDAGNNPLQLHIEVLKDGSPIAPRFIADLPSLNELLPRTKDASMPLRRLEFRRVNKSDAASMPNLDI